MPDDMEWIVPMTPVRDADRGAPPEGPARVAELRRQVRAGHYATASMMELVARRILQLGDL